jgi:hypothetical protein
MSQKTRAAYCQACGTYVPADTRHCPKCHDLHMSQEEAEQLLSSHRRNLDCQFSKDYRPQASRTKPRLPEYCPWCGTKVQWGEDKQRPGRWIGLDTKKASKAVSGSGLGNISSGSDFAGWTYNMLLNRHQVTLGLGGFAHHRCSPDLDPHYGSPVYKYLEVYEPPANRGTQ